MPGAPVLRSPHGRGTWPLGSPAQWPGTDRRCPPRAHPWHLILCAVTASLERARDRYVRGSVDILDVGCGDMPYYPLFADVATRYVGADVEPGPHVEYVCPAESLSVPDAAFDLVLSTQVLEHVRHPARALAEIERVLRPGGYAFVTTHGVWPFHPYPGDYWRWTQEGFHALVQDSGRLELVELAPHGGSWTCLATLNAHYIHKLATRLKVQPLGRALIAIMNLLAPRFDRAMPSLSYPNSETLIATFLLVLRKPLS